MAFVEVGGLRPFPYRWMSHAPYEVLLCRGLVLEGLKTEIKSGKFKCLVCLLVHVKPSGHESPLETTVSWAHWPAGSITAWQIIWEIVMEACSGPELQTRSFREQSFACASTVRLFHPVITCYCGFISSESRSTKFWSCVGFFRAGLQYRPYLFLPCCSCPGNKQYIIFVSSLAVGN